MLCQQFADEFVLKKCSAKANVSSAKWVNQSASDDLERFLADWERDNGSQLPPKAPATGKKVAVVGAGPAGLTVAADLVKLGHEITMFEALHVGGGVLSYGIPEFRLPKAIVQNEVNYVQKLGVDLRLGNLVGRIHTIPELMKERLRRSIHRQRRRLTTVHRLPRRKPRRNLLS